MTGLVPSTAHAGCTPASVQNRAPRRRTGPRAVPRAPHSVRPAAHVNRDRRLTASEPVGWSIGPPSAGAPWRPSRRSSTPEA